MKQEAADFLLDFGELVGEAFDPDAVCLLALAHPYLPMWRLRLPPLDSDLAVCIKCVCERFVQSAPRTGFAPLSRESAGPS